MPDQQNDGIPDALSQPAEAYADPRLQNILSGLIGGIKQQVATPGAVMQPNPYPAGSDEAAWYDNNRAATMANWAPGMALGMIGGSGVVPGEAGALRSGINWDRSTVSHGNLPVYGDKTVVEVPTAALDKAFKATDPRAHADVVKPKQEVVDYAASGKPMSLPEVDATNGRIGFTNGRNRFAVARDNGEAMIPVATETPEALQALLAKHVEPPKQTLPQYINSGPYSGETTPLSGKTLHHETSPENAVALIREDLTNEASKIRPSKMFLTDNPDIAIGQGGQGVRVEYNGDLVSGAEHVKPGTGDRTGREYQANGIGNGAIQRITVAPGERMDLPPAWERRLGSSFDKQEMPDGSVVYTHKTMPAPSQTHVILDDNLKAIVKKYGMAGLQMLPPATAAFLSKRMTPVQHNPFATGGNPAITPVDGDPFNPEGNT